MPGRGRPPRNALPTPTAAAAGAKSRIRQPQKGSGEEDAAENLLTPPARGRAPRKTPIALATVTRPKSRVRQQPQKESDEEMSTLDFLEGQRKIGYAAERKWMRENKNRKKREKGYEVASEEEDEDEYEEEGPEQKPVKGSKGKASVTLRKMGPPPFTPKGQPTTKISEDSDEYSGASDVGLTTRPMQVHTRSMTSTENTKKGTVKDGNPDDSDDSESSNDEGDDEEKGQKDDDKKDRKPKQESEEPDDSGSSDDKAGEKEDKKEKPRDKKPDDSDSSDSSDDDDDEKSKDKKPKPKSKKAVLAAIQPLPRDDSNERHQPILRYLVAAFCGFAIIIALAAHSAFVEPSCPTWCHLRNEEVGCTYTLNVLIITAIVTGARMLLPQLPYLPYVSEGLFLMIGVGVGSLFMLMANMKGSVYDPKCVLFPTYPFPLLGPL